MQPARKGRDAPQIADENEECHKGQQQGVIHIAESGAVSAEGTDQHSGKGNAVGQYPDDRQQTDRKQHRIQQDDFPVCGGVRLLRERTDAGGCLFAADRDRPAHQKQQRNDRVGEHEQEELRHAHSAFAVEVEVLWVADGREHTAKVGRDGLHTHHWDGQRPAGVRRKAAQHHKGKGDKGQQGNVVGDDHAPEKAQPDQNEHQLQGAAGPCQQRPAHPVKNALPPQPGHDGHQGKQNGERAQVNVTEVVCIRRHKEHGEHGQYSGDRKNGLLFEKSL